MNKTLGLALLLSFPMIGHAQTVQLFIVNFVAFLGNVIIPFLFGLAFLFLVINVIRFFVIGGSNEEGREKAKALAIYSVLAFVILITFWGIINMLGKSIGLSGVTAPTTDYIAEQKRKNTSSGSIPPPSGSGPVAVPSGPTAQNASQPMQPGSTQNTLSKTQPFQQPYQGESAPEPEDDSSEYTMFEVQTKQESGEFVKTGMVYKDNKGDILRFDTIKEDGSISTTYPKGVAEYNKYEAEGAYKNAETGMIIEGGDPGVVGGSDDYDEDVRD